jgi:hypothetical protein
VQLIDGTSEKYGKTMQWHEILGSDSSVAEDSSFLGYDAVLGEWFPMFQRIIRVCPYLQGQAAHKE